MNILCLFSWFQKTELGTFTRSFLMVLLHCSCLRAKNILVPGSWRKIVASFHGQHIFLSCVSPAAKGWMQSYLWSKSATSVKHAVLSDSWGRETINQSDHHTSLLWNHSVSPVKIQSNTTMEVEMFSASDRQNNSRLFLENCKPRFSCSSGWRGLGTFWSLSKLENGRVGCMWPFFIVAHLNGII